MFGCAPSTIKKAIDNTESLRSWARPGKASAPKAQSLNEVVMDNTSQSRESDPTDVLEESEVDAAMQYLIDQAGPDERARIFAMPAADRRKLAELVYNDPDKGDRILSRKA
jgi:hypothetical protein